MHAAIYLTTVPAVFTGWWILASRGGWLGHLFAPLGPPSAQVHVWLGRAMAVAIAAALVIGGRRVATLVRETFRVDPGDGRWWLRWPSATMTGRFARHEGLFDPGQRVANVILLGGLAVLTVTGLALTNLHGGPTFAVLDRIHRLATLVVTPVIIGHVLVALGILPGYRGVWRSMHLRGRVPEATARRIWPGWTERALTAADNDEHTPPRDAPSSASPPAKRGERAITRE